MEEQTDLPLHLDTANIKPNPVKLCQRQSFGISHATVDKVIESIRWF